MSIDERIEQSNQKMDEVKSKANASAERSKNAHKMNKQEIEDNMQVICDEIDDLNEALLDDEARKNVEAINESLDEIGDEIIKDVNDRIETIEGNHYAAQEDRRIRRERTKSKLDALGLKLQMNREAHKDKIANRKMEKDIKKTEKHIEELLDYADSCGEFAISLIIEAEYSVMEAMAEAAELEEKYGNE